MELRHLRYFAAVAKVGGFARAASVLHVSQPALSRQIKDLERELGVPLFERLPHGIRLTRDGTRFLADAKRLLAGADRALARARSGGRARGADLVIGFGEMVAHWPEINAALHRFRVNHAEISLHTLEVGRKEMQAALREDRIDLCVVGMVKFPPRGFDGLRLKPTFMTGVLLAESHPLARNDVVRLASLSQLTWFHVNPDATWDVFNRLRDDFRGAGFDPRHRVARAGSYAFLPQIAAGEGWALADDVLRNAVVGVTEGIVYRPFDVPPFELWMTAVWKKGNQSREIRAFIDIARSLCERLSSRA